MAAAGLEVRGRVRHCQATLISNRGRLGPSRVGMNTGVALLFRKKCWSAAVWRGSLRYYIVLAMTVYAQGLARTKIHIAGTSRHRCDWCRDERSPAMCDCAQSQLDDVHRLYITYVWFHRQPKHTDPLGAHPRKRS